MAKGISEEQIRSAITELEATGDEVTVRAIRKRLGTGSYTTIEGVFQEWKRERDQEKRPAVPDLPEKLLPLLRALWSEAWSSASSVFEPERKIIEAERREFATTRSEMTAEITRLEGEIYHLVKEFEDTRLLLSERDHTLESLRLELAKVGEKAELLSGEKSRLEEEAREAQDTLREWIERGTKAETLLSERQKQKGEQRGEGATGGKARKV